MSDVSLEQSEPISIAKPLTLDTFMALGSDARVEVMNGEVVEMSPVGGLHHIIAGNLQRILDQYVFARKTGIVFPDGLIYLMHSKSAGLKDSFVPDVSYLHKDSIPKDWDVTRPFPGAPDLAVEIVSPGDDALKLNQKVRTYLEKGTIQVWVVYPDSGELHQFRRDASDRAHIYQLEGGNDHLTDIDPLFPELELTLQTIFEMPDWIT